MPHTCGIMVQAFLHPEWNIRKGEGFENYDLECGIMNAEDLIRAGHLVEPMDHRNLRKFIIWATEKLIES